MTGRRRHPEQQLQRAVVEYLRIMENMRKLAFFHPANGGGRTRTEAAIFKGLGVRPGVPDLVLLLPDGRAAFVEQFVRGLIAGGADLHQQGGVGGGVGGGDSARGERPA